MTRPAGIASRVAAAALLALVAACSGTGAVTTGPQRSPASTPTRQQTAAPSRHDRPEHPPLRPGEHFTRLAMPAPYIPKAPAGSGTDDYRCFLLDPHLAKNAFLTGIDILPGDPEVVHHVILFRVPPGSVQAAERRDASDPGQGWTCFGGTGLDTGAELDNAPWLGAWAPGGGEGVLPKDVGIPVQAGSRVVMQVHYNLLAGPGPDLSAARLRMTAGTEALEPLRTMLLPAPVELPCRPGHDGPLCDRGAAVSDVQRRFGHLVGQAANYLHLLCGYRPAGPVQRCDRQVQQPQTIRAVAGHMHLLGRSIAITVNPGTSHARTVLDIPVWNFDDQGARPVEPVHLKRGDTVRVTCRHSQRLRDLLPAFRGQPERYVVWGEGTTDEMCLGLLLVTRP
jgi:hypothetical protein